MIKKHGPKIAAAIAALGKGAKDGAEAVIMVGGATIYLVWKGGQWVVVKVVRSEKVGKAAKTAGEALLGYLTLREMTGNHGGGMSAPGLPGVPWDIYPHPSG